MLLTEQGNLSLPLSFLSLSHTHTHARAHLSSQMTFLHIVECITLLAEEDAFEINRGHYIF